MILPQEHSPSRRVPILTALEGGAEITAAELAQLYFHQTHLSYEYGGDPEGFATRMANMRANLQPLSNTRWYRRGSGHSAAIYVANENEGLEHKKPMNSDTICFDGVERHVVESQICLFAWCVELKPDKTGAALTYFEDAIHGRIGKYTTYTDGRRPTMYYSLDEQEASGMLTDLEKYLGSVFAPPAEDYSPAGNGGHIKPIPKDGEFCPYNSRAIDRSPDDFASYPEAYRGILKLLSV